MFQLFVAKQVFNISAVLANLAKQKAYAHLGKLCPSCTLHNETTEHLLYCTETGREMNFRLQLRQVRTWLSWVGTNWKLTDTIMAFLASRGSMNIAGNDFYVHPIYVPFWQSQDHIGWRRTMEGMLSHELLTLPQEDLLQEYSRLTPQVWFHGLVQKILEATHGIWIYRNLTMHDGISGVVATKRKEQLLKEIESQMEQGGEGLEEQDKWMAEVNLSNLETSSGEQESYWLIAIQAARARFQILSLHKDSTDMS
jgi:hypothetical protein